jgi:hypothetical protein
MTLAYLPEYADKARLALDLAEREAKHLAYTIHCSPSRSTQNGSKP